MKEQVPGREDSWEFEFSGGSLCLDFTNTLPDRPCCQKEHLTSFNRLLTWTEQANLVSTDQADRIRIRAREDSELAGQILDEARNFRECLFRIFSTLAKNGSVATDDIEMLNRRVTAAYAQLRLKVEECQFEWAYSQGQNFLESVLHPIARSTAELLTSPELDLVRECGAPTCSWLFIDRSRTKRKRWCDMKTCGNRAKAKRFYERHK